MIGGGGMLLLLNFQVPTFDFSLISYASFSTQLCRSFLYGGSSGLFVFGYCLYYYYARSGMSGFVQTSIFFGYMAFVSYAVFVMLGAVGFYAASFFVQRLYGSMKFD